MFTGFLFTTTQLKQEAYPQISLNTIVYNADVNSHDLIDQCAVTINVRQSSTIAQWSSTQYEAVINEDAIIG